MFAVCTVRRGVMFVFYCVKFKLWVAVEWVDQVLETELHVPGRNPASVLRFQLYQATLSRKTPVPCLFGGTFRGPWRYVYKKSTNIFAFIADPSMEPCPRSLTQAMADRGRFMSDEECNPSNREGCSRFHDGAVQCFKMVNPR